MNEQTFNQMNVEKLAEIIDIDNTIATTAAVNVVDIQINHLCPHCGESYYMENYNTRTCLYYPPIYKDGVNINPDRNITTTYCTCMNCGKGFSFTT